MTQTLTHFINGASVEGTSGRFADVYHPAKGEVAAKLPLAAVSEVNNAVAIAAKAQIEWAALNAQRRARILGRFVDRSEERRVGKEGRGGRGGEAGKERDMEVQEA